MWNITRREEKEITEIRTNYRLTWECIMKYAKILQDSWDEPEKATAVRELLKIGRDAAIYRAIKGYEYKSEWERDYEYKTFDWVIQPLRGKKTKQLPSSEGEHHERSRASKTRPQSGAMIELQQRSPVDFNKHEIAAERRLLNGAPNGKNTSEEHGEYKRGK